MKMVARKDPETILKTPVCLVVWVALALSSAWVMAAAEGSPLPSAQATSLAQAAKEFKVLTRQRGMRPNSPPTALQHHGRKWLWHGRIDENFRNDFLDAIPHNVKQNGQTKSPLRRNQFGFNIAGPLLIPHVVRNPHNTFAMLSYEGVRERISLASLHTVPTVPQRMGDFSQTVDQAGHPLPVYDPAVTVANPNYNPNQPVSTSNLQYLRPEFPGNIIPASRLVPNVVRVLSLYPQPNTNVGPFFQHNYFVNSSQADNADGVIAKIDHQIGARHQLTGATAISKGYLSTAPYFPTIATPTAPDQHFSSWRSDLDYSFTANANTVNTADLIVSSNMVRAGDGLQSSFPRYDLAGTYLPMGVAFPTSRNVRNTIELGDGISMHKGKHSLQLTLSANRYQVNTFNPEYPSGDFEFSTGITSLPGIIDTGDPFASLLLGLPQYAERSITPSPSYFRDSYQSIAGNDKYEVSKDFTLSFGLNFSRRTPRAEKYNRESTVDPYVIDPATNHLGALVFAGRNGIPRGLREANIDLDPSIGIAWNPRGDANTVIRASFSRFHSMIPIYNGQWGTQGFNALQTFISANNQLSPAMDLATGLPAFTTPLPNLNPSAADNTVADFVDLSGREPAYRRASLSVERDLPLSTVLSVGANYGDGHDILVGDSAANPNAINPQFLSYGNALYNQAFRETLQPYPQYLGFELYGLYPAGSYRRNSAYIRVEKQESFGLSFIGFYEYSRQFDDYSGPYGNQYLLNLADNWALTSYNTPQFLQLSYLYELPFGPNKPLLHFSGLGAQLVSGWSVNGTAYWNDGMPLAMHPEFNNTGGVLPTLYVNVVPGVDPHVSNPGPSMWFNPAAFSQPPDFTPGNGSSTQPDLLGPGFNSMDLSLNKRLPIGGSRTLEFNATAFNLLNHGNWNTPDTGIGPASAPNVDAGKIIGSHGGRVIQLGVEVNF
jgi:hypothetical protein